MTAERMAPLVPALLLLFPAILNFGRWIQLRRHSPPASQGNLPADELIATSPRVSSLSWPPDVPKMLRALGRWVAGHQLETSLAGLLLVLILYVGVFSPDIRPSAMPVPRTPGSPYNAIHFIRDFQLRVADDLPYPIGVIGAAASLACLVGSFLKRSIDAARTGLLASGLGLLALWQLTNLGFYTANSPTILIFAGLVVLAWVFAHRPYLMGDLQPRAPLAPLVEVTLFVVALVPTILGRTMRLSTIPYGIEGDELKWTVEVARSMLDGEFAEATEYHLSSVPVSFYLEAPFLRLLGPSLMSARIASVSFSLLGSVAFYFLARALLGSQVAWLATFLLGVSLLDTSASRLANVESLTKIWPPLSLLLLARAVDTRRLALFLAAGAAVALGMLAYDTVVPLAVVGIVLLTFELVRTRTRLAESVRHLSAYLGPQLLVLPVVAAYIGGRLQYYQLADRGLQEDLVGRLQEHAASLVEGLFVLTPRDFLFNRDGPLFQSLLIPWLLLGLVLAVVNWRRGRVLWVAVYLAVFFLPTPILANVPMGRVLFPGLPAAYLLVAIAAICAYREAERLLGPAFRPALLTLGGIGLLQLAVLNQYIYFNEVQDSEDRRIRREVYEIARGIGESGVGGFFPYVPGAGEAIEDESGYAIWLGLRSRSNGPLQLSESPVLPVETLLPSLSRLGPTERGVVIVWDKTAGATQEMRDQLLATIFRCYPGRAERPGTYFDEYFINRSTLEAALCGSGELSLAATGADGTSTPLLWSWTGAPISEAVLSCGLLSREALTIPAEALSGPGWSPEARFRQDFRGDGFLIDNYGSAEAAYALQLPRAGTYYVWVRSLRRRVDSFPAYLTFGDAHVPISGPGSPIDVWHWERLGPFQVNRVNPKLSLARPYAGAPTEFMALFFDEIVLTTDPTYDPQVDTLMGDLQKLPVDLRPGETEGHIDLDLPPGNYTCWLTVSDGDRIVDPYGDLGVDSDTLKIIIR